MCLKKFISRVLAFLTVVVPKAFRSKGLICPVFSSCKIKVNSGEIKHSSLFVKRFIYTTIALFIFGFSIFAKTTTLTSAAGTISGGGTWSNGIPAAGDIIVVNSGCTLTIGANFSLAELRVNGGGTVTFNPNFTLTVSGNVTVNSNSLNGATTINITNTNSTLNVAGNVIINPPANTNTNTINVNAGTLICGNITTTCTTATQKTDIRITSGSLTATGYSSTGAQAGSNTFQITGNGTANINGNYTGGTFTGGPGTLNIGGSFGPNSFTANTCTINYNGTNPQTIANLAYSNLTCSNTGPKTTTAAITVSNDAVINGGTLTLGANLAVAGSLNVTSGTLDCQTFSVSGGTFTLASGTTLISANVDGITSAGATGSIRSATRNYNTGANYEFDAGAAQVTGNGLPATVNNLTINNPNGVTLSQAVIVNGSLLLVSGNINLGSNNLTIGTSATISGTFGSTCMVNTSGIGSIIKLGNTVADFTIIYPVGSGGYYTPMEITSLTAIVNPVSSVAIHAAPIQKMPSTSALKKYWYVSSANLSSIQANIRFTYNQLEVEGTESNYVTRKYDGSAFQISGGASINTTTNVITVTGVSSLTGDWTAIDLNGISPEINGPVGVYQGCTQVYTVSPGFTNYNWIITGGSIISGQGTNSVVVGWDATTGEGSVFVSYTQGGLSVVYPTLAVTRYAFPLSCFQYKRQIDIKGTMVSGGPHNNFQLLVNVTDVALKSTDNGGHITHNGGYDIYFSSDASGNIPLEYQLDYYDPVTGQLVAWIKMPTLTNVNSSIYLFYGNSSVNFDASTADVWGADYVGVYHMGQNLNDYSLGCNDGINVGTSTVSGKIGQGRQFIRTEKDFIQLLNESPFNFGSQMTISFWVRLNSYPGTGNDWMDYIVKGDNKNWRFVGNKPNAGMYYCFGNEYSDDLASANNSVPLNNWVHVVGTFNGNNTPSPLKNLFVNGTKVTRTANHSSISDYLTDNSPVLVGINSQAQDTRAFDGIMDELQISNQFKTDGWIITGYRNQSDLTSVSLSGTEQVITISNPAVGGIASATPGSIYAREYSVLTLTGYTGTSILWQSSTDNINFSDLPGKVNAVQQTDPLLINTYFRARVVNGGCPSVSDTTYVLVTPPYITCSNGMRKKITIDNSKYTGTDDLVNFPFLLQINNDNDLKLTPTGKVQSNKGWDIRFTSSDGISMLPQQVESYNPVNGSILVWVQIPVISAGQNTEIYMYYGDLNFAGSDPSISAVFGPEYRGVYHMGTGTGKSLFELNDASIAGNNGTNTGTTNIATGKIGVASGFNGTSQYITLPNESQFDIPNNGKLTISGWMNITTYSASAYAKYFDKGTGSWTVRRDNNSLRVEMRQDYQNPEYLSAINTSGIATGAWHYLVATYDHETNNMMLYIDGSAAASSKNVPANQILQNNGNQVRIGADAGATPGNYFRGNMDEVRIQNVSRTMDWIKFEYDNMNSPVGFAAISAETSCSLGAPTPGTASADKTNLCPDQSAILTLTGYDGGIYWQQSTDNINWSYITGENNPTLNTGAITQNTYFRASVSNCCEAFSNTLLINYVATSAPSLDFTVTDVKCNGQSNGAIDLTVTQGSGSFSYLWSNASANQDISSLAVGIYDVTVTDLGSSCSTKGQAIIYQPGILAVSISKTDETCPGIADGSASATPSGGTLPYTFSWSNSSSSSNNTTLTNGLYTLTVTDSKTCTVTASTTIATINSSPEVPTSASSDRDNFCEDDAGNISLSAGGGSGTTIRWYKGSCGGTDIGTDNPLIITSPVATTTYYVRWENICGSTACTGVTVTVNTLPATTLIHHDE